MNKFESDSEAIESFQKHYLNVGRTILLQATEDDRGEEGPKHKEWNKRYQESLAKKLKAAGFSKNEIQKIIQEYLRCLRVVRNRGLFLLCMIWFIIKQINRLWVAKKCILAEYKDEGEPPPWKE